MCSSSRAFIIKFQKFTYVQSSEKQKVKSFRTHNRYEITINIIHTLVETFDS